MRTLSSGLALVLLSSIFLACGGADTSSTEGDLPGSTGGSGGKGGAGGSGQAGAAGNPQGGAGGGSSGQGGSAGSAGNGQAGDAGSGQAGDAGSGQAGDAGSGQAGDGGSGQAGDGGSGQGGDAGSGQAGDAGSGQAGSGQGGSGGVAISDACQGCIATNCDTQFNACAAEPACLACATGDPTTVECLSNANLLAAVGCACQPSTCAATDCAAECALLGGGQGGAGAGGDGGGGQAGDAGSGQAGDGGSGQAGDGGSGQAGDAGSGQAGDAGSGQAGSGQAGSNGGCDPVLVGLPCNTGFPGVCSDGIRECTGGQLVCVPAVAPGQQAEACDGKDNDCDGIIDEDVAGSNEPCVVPGQVGPCSQGLTICDSKGALTCKPSALAQPEICDGIDNNCDGFVDNKPTDADAPCDTGQLGPCGTGVTSCFQGKLTCETLVLPNPETCNGVDDNCDGSVDNGIADLACGLGECANSTPACINGQPQTCFPKASSAEVCDGKDNDCDGSTDEENVCCPVAQRCGSLCCMGGDVCSFQKCVKPGVLCYASDDCGANEYCDYTLGTVNNPPPGCQGTKQKTGKCMPKPPTCSGNEQPGDPPACVLKCEYKPPTKPFEPVLKYSWGGVTASPFTSDVMMTPIVVQLDDDDCDGKITERDIPEIVFTTFASGAYTANGTLRAISIVNGVVKEKWSVAGGIWASSELAAGNFDGLPGNEIVGVYKEPDNTYRLRAFKADGTQLWKGTEPVSGRMPAIADLDGDGLPEIVQSGKVFNGKTGALKLSVNVGNSTVADIDGDNVLDIVGAIAAYKANGTLIASTPLAGATMAIGDLDLDGKPEVVTVSNAGHVMHIWRYDATAASKYKIIRQNIDINGSLPQSLCPSGSAGNTGGGGPPTIADFNGDGTPDVALAGGIGYAVFDGKKLMDTATYANNQTFLWQKQTQDCSSAVTGSSLFDFNGDGKAEVLYGDEIRFRVYDGSNGNVLFSTCNTTGTLYEYPVIADVDNDGQADIIVASNAYAFTCDSTKQSGIRIFSSKNSDWVRTRRVWNQHTYHITNVNEDGSIPKNELPNWKQPGLNNFRINKQPGGEFAAPDLVISLVPNCSSPYALLATVRNLGEAPVGPGVKVGFYKADGTKLGEGSTTTELYPADAEVVSLQLNQAPAGEVYAIADDNSPPHAWVECRTSNNKSALTPSTCSQ